MRVLFVRFGSIGNALVSVPAIRAIRKAHPSAFLALLCDPNTYQLWKDCPWLDQVIIYDQNHKHKAGPGYLQLIAQLRKFEFTHSVHFRRFLRSELLGFLAGAKQRVGFDPGGFSLLTQKIPYSEQEHIIDQNLKLAQALGARELDPALEYWTAPPSEKVKKILSQIPSPRIILHPFARTQAQRRWSGFARLSEKIARKLFLHPIIIGTRDEEKIFHKEWRKKSELVYPAFGLSIPELASLLVRSQLFIGMDSGPLHLACAVQIPAIAIYVPEPRLEKNLKKWKPKSEKFYAIIPDKSCSNCPIYPCSPETLKSCLERISEENILNICQKILNEIKK